MTTVVVSTQESKVTTSVVENKVEASNASVTLILSPPNAPQLSVQAATASSVAVSLAAAASVTVERPPGITVETLTATVSENRILDLNRLDASDTQFNYENGKLVGVVRDNYTKTFTYDQNGVLQAVVVTTASGTITKTFSYNSGSLTSITVT